jgi:hypothetical protein
MLPPSRLILIEFNELCPNLLQRFMQRGLLPNFQRFHDSSVVCTTDAGEREPNLEPWIQWPTVHSGLPFAEHRIFHLGDGRRLEHRCLAEILSDADIPVGVCGSMNLNYRQLNGYVLPDPWDKEGIAHPEFLRPFYQTIAHQVQESSRTDAGSKKELFRFGLFLLRNGLTAGTAWAVVKQLWSERRDGGLRWRRASLLDRLQYDVFRSLNQRFAVRFATFFCNSTAHYQHYHWRNMDPERFTAPPPATDHPSLREAIPYGYRQMDVLLGRFLKDYPDAVLVLCTALSQQPWVDTTKCTFRPRCFKTLLEFVGADAAPVKPVMAEQFHVECDSPAVADRVASCLRDLTLDGAEPLLFVKREGGGVFAGCRATDVSVLQRSVTRRRDGQRRPFGELFYLIHSMRSGRHHPDGVLWWRNGRQQVLAEKVPLTDIAPTVLAHFGIAPPAAMHGQPLFFNLPTCDTVSLPDSVRDSSWPQRRGAPCP